MDDCQSVGRSVGRTNISRISNALLNTPLSDLSWKTEELRVGAFSIRHINTNIMKSATKTINWLAHGLAMTLLLFLFDNGT